VICLRIGLAVPHPDRPVARHAWVSPRDLTQLINVSVDTERGYGVYFAVSANTSLFWSTDNARADLGYQPVDNAADWVTRPDDGSAWSTQTLRSPCFDGGQR
jgi:hypothetical protein